MIVEKYLKTLATTRHRIIIPDLGAFLSKDGDGDLKNLIFSSFLKYNDGNLEKHIAEQEGLSPEQSAEEVKKFSEEVSKTVKAKRQYSIDGFGYFYQDERGGISFAVDAAAMPAPQPVKEEYKATTVAATAKSEDAIAIEDTVKQQATTTETELVAPAAAPAVAPQPSVRVKREETVVVPPAPTSKPAGKQEKSGSTNKLLIVIIILLLLIAALIGSYFIFDSVRERVNAILGIENTALVKPEEVAPPVVDSTQLAKPDTIAAQPTPKTIEGELPVTPTVAGMYYVIAGTFQEYANAVRLYKRCAAEGYQVELLPKMGPLYPIAVYKTKDLKDADRMMREVKRKYGDAWVFKARR